MEAPTGCIAAGGRAMRRFRKLAFWPTVEIEGEDPSWPTSCCKLWSATDHFVSRAEDDPTQVVLPLHSVHGEPDFSS